VLSEIATMIKAFPNFFSAVPPFGGKLLVVILALKVRTSRSFFLIVVIIVVIEMREVVELTEDLSIGSEVL
jgi:hypothetical protein